ncbi:ATP-binding protein [Leptolyngbya sp. PCC 6406]|uniref:ATP-binding protein n=1 Tax=Leptolyngbya sp. PCC 6406 TaxID=1173264 RepID=UPI0002AC1706|nr:ATP-binding protein [Leptolyngbya sp. PCC 6406]
MAFSDRLPRSLSSLETWGFGLTGLLLWLGVAPAMQLDLGPQVLWVWLPGTVIGVLINLQVRRLGETWADLSGGTPSYIRRLLPDRPGLATYAALGYYLSWVSALPVSAIVLADLVRANLEPFGLACPTVVLEVGFTAIAFVVALTGTRALGVLHLFFVVPAIALMLLFCLQGLGWLVWVDSVELPRDWGQFHLGNWAKWYIISSYAVYACETAAAFVADSRNPHRTLQVLPVAAVLIPLVYLGGSGVLLGLADPALGANTPYEQLLGASPFWGQSAPLIVTFLLAVGSLLICATAVSNSPRILYQLALDGHLPASFAQLSRQGVLGPGLLLTLILSIACLLWGDIAQIVLVTGIGWMSSFVIFHWGLWRQRQQDYVLWPWWSLGFAGLEVVAIGAGGWSWGATDLVLGLALPGGAWLLGQTLGRIPLPPSAPELPLGTAVQRSDDFIMGQIGGLIALITGAIVLSWLIHDAVDALPTQAQSNILIVVLLIGASVGVAIAGWTMLPQVAAVATAREQAEQFFNLAADGIMVLDEGGRIQQANQASERLFAQTATDLRGMTLEALLPDLPIALTPQTQSGKEALTAALGERMVEVTLSRPSVQMRAAVETEGSYVAVLRDITLRRAAEDALRIQAQELKQLLDELTRTQSQLVQAEKLSSLGQLMAGVAHEINNPVSFISGNVTFAQDYAKELLALMAAFRQAYPNPPPDLVEKMAAVDVDFLQADFPRLLASMQEGAERINRIVRSLSTFSRQDNLPTPGIKLQEGIDSTIMILQNRLKAQGHRPAIALQQQFNNVPLVECYPSALNQVFMNLLVNAIDALEEAMHQDPTLEPQITIAATATPHNGEAGVEIRIGDNGLGIPTELRDRLCDPFFTTKPIGKGTGLGLSISYQVVVEQHRGRFTVESTPGSGATFILWLPQTLAAAPTAVAIA